MLKHEDVSVAFFEVIGNSVGRLKINDTCRGHLPVGVLTESDLKYWIENRGIPVTRHNIKSDLELVHIISPFVFMLENYGLSLTDHYWICPRDSDYTWNDINLYINDFKSSYSLDLKDDIRSIAGFTNFIPSSSLKGDLKKKWIIDKNGTRRLVKGNYSNTCRQSLCEVLATYIHRCQNKFDYTTYGLIEISSDNQNIIGCECENFTSISTEFIPAIEIINSVKKPNDMSYYESYVNLCLHEGVDLRKFMEYQIMVDFIISNTDRHLNNFGIIRDTTTLDWLRPAPIFDSGNSMFYKSNYIPTGSNLLDLKVTSFLEKESKLLSYVTDRGLVDTRLLPDDIYMYNLLSIDMNTRDDVNEKLVKAYNKKIKYLLDFQNGADIWSYKYKG